MGIVFGKGGLLSRIFDRPIEDLNAAWNKQMTDMLGFGSGGLGSQFMGGFQNFMQGSGDDVGVRQFLNRMLAGTAPGMQYLQRLGAPNAEGGWMRQFMGSVPELQNIVMGASSPLEQNLLNAQRRWTSQAVGDVAAQLAPMGGAFSSATGRLAAQDVANRAADQWLDVNKLQMGLFGDLAGRSMAGYQTGAQQAAGLGLNLSNSILSGLLSGGQLYGGLAGQMAGLMPNFAPQWVSQPSLWDKVISPIKDVVGIVAAIKGLSKPGENNDKPVPLSGLLSSGGSLLGGGGAVPMGNQNYMQWMQNQWGSNPNFENMLQGLFMGNPYLSSPNWQTAMSLTGGGSGASALTF